MSLKVLKAGFTTVLFIFLHCVNNPSSKVHPLMILEAQRVNDSSRVIISTTVANDYSMYRIIEDSCTVTYPWSTTTSVGLDSAFIARVAIANDSAGSSSGTFHGIWEVPDSLFKYGSIRIYACVQDETNHGVCTALVLQTN